MTTDALAKRAADEVEYRVRTAIALYKGGHDYQAEIVKGRAAAEQIVREATGEHYEIEMPCGDAAPHARHVWQMSSTGYCLCEGEQATATETPPAAPTTAREALADMPTHVAENGVRYGRLGERTADYIIETLNAVVATAWAEMKNRSDLARAQRVGAVEQADEYLSTHRKTEVWSLINRLRDELVRA